MNINKYLSVLLLVFSVMFLGCANVPKEKSVVQNINGKEINKNNRRVEKISKVLTQNGYVFEILNENLGIVKTDWKDVTDQQTNTSNKINAFGAILKGTLDKEYIYMQLNIKVDEEKYTLIPKLKSVTIKKGLLVTDKIEKPYQFSLEKTVYQEQIEQLVKHINKELKLKDDYQWVISEKI